MSRRRVAFTILGALAVTILVFAMVLVVTLQSSWFYNRVRQRIVSEIEKATGGRTDLQAFRFDWKQMRAQVDGLTVHGKEPAGRPPLLHASSVAVGLKVISLLKRDVDVQYLEVSDPRIYLIVNPDGSTNLPAPKTPRDPNARPLDPLFRLAAGRFALRRGIFEVEAQGRTSFDARGQNLDLALFLDGPLYRGTLAIHPLEVRAPGLAPTPLDVTLSLALARNRIAITTASVSTGGSRLQFNGALEDLTAPHGTFQYQANAAVADAAHAFGIKLLERGALQSQGTVTWPGGSNYQVTGDFHASGVQYLGAYVQLRNALASGTLVADPRGLELRGVRFSTSVAGGGKCTGGTWPCATQLAGNIAAADIGGRNLDLRGIAVALLGGGFHGQARLENLERFSVTGEVSGMEARRAVALYSTVPLPWNGLISGKTHVEGILQRRNELRAAVDLTLAPLPGSPPVHGQVTATYDARGPKIDLGHSRLDLPSTHAEASGVVGERLTVHVDSHDLNDLLPALGQNAAALPVKLQNGSAVFDGVITGAIDRPEAQGRVTATNAIYSGQNIDSFQANVDATPDRLRLRDASLAHGTLRSQFQMDVALHEWKAEDSSLIDGSGSIRNAPVKDLAALVTANPIPASGALNATAKINGSIGDPLVAANFEVTAGQLQDEPFDRFTGHLQYTGRQLQLTGGQLAAGAKTARVSATFDHAPRVFDAGRVHFDAATNAMPVDQIHTMQADRPDVKGTLQATAAGTLDIATGRNGELGIRVVDLHGDVAGHSLQLKEQPLGDLHLTVNTQGQELRAHLDSAIAKSNVQGDGSWKLEGDYPGSATIAFSRVDFAALRDWVMPLRAATPLPFAGFAEGQLRIEGELLKPRTNHAELRIPTLEITEAPRTPRPAASAASLTLKNSGPIVATLANSVVTVNSAHLVGRDTDFTVTGKVTLTDKSPLDLRVNGKVDLAIVHEINRDFNSSGAVSADATIRGPLAAPQISGRVAFQNAAFQVSDLPNGITGANGVLVFTGDRVTIQNFSGETGGGKVALTGFAAYGVDNQLVFRIHARVDEVRIRYPEGVSTVANASLNFTGTTDSSMLSGTVTVLRTGFNPQSDFSSIIAASAEPVHTPSVRAGILGGMSFDIQIQTAPDIQVQSTLTEDIAMEASLRLRGTFSNPAILGRVTITQGQVIFFGTKYAINQGTISFYNPVRVEPVLNIDLETKARGIDITLTVSGPLAKLNLTPRSDPPLQFNEIVALLATGRTPTNDPTLLAQQATAPQSWQQMGASALLGQAIASPVTGRLQRFFGVSKLRIDPTLPGIENNPQARLTLEQQVTPDITFTYITNVTNSNPQVVRVEWAFAKQWSVVALREENGMFGIDFFYKRRF